MSQRPDNSQCQEHSGMFTRMNIGIGLLSILVGLFGYSSFVQIPRLESYMKDQYSGLDKRMMMAERDISQGKIEDERIKAQRNADHPAKDKFQ